eukprot:TRINITY_DN9842_c0_g1_i1.p1 TRINITY_DN9842_c0_g1~~TRINITY_DN9842_c0_g1_i1.p1  ORF type:complete len:212 (-),score=39.05 TRINITY_DN9842_c0_g1_i1:54-689(-)
MTDNNNPFENMHTFMAPRSDHTPINHFHPPYVSLPVRSNHNQSYIEYQRRIEQQILDQKNTSLSDFQLALKLQQEEQQNYASYQSTQLSDALMASQLRDQQLKLEQLEADRAFAQQLQRDEQDRDSRVMVKKIKQPDPKNWKHVQRVHATYCGCGNEGDVDHVRYTHNYHCNCAGVGYGIPRKELHVCGDACCRERHVHTRYCRCIERQRY